MAGPSDLRRPKPTPARRPEALADGPEGEGRKALLSGATEGRRRERGWLLAPSHVEGGGLIAESSGLRAESEGLGALSWVA